MCCTIRDETSQAVEVIDEICIDVFMYLSKKDRGL